jgi:hypothetical protein
MGQKARVWEGQSHTEARYPTEDQVEYWIAEYPSLGQIEICGTMFYFRAITRKENNTSVSLSQQNEAAYEDYICKLGCLWPTNFNFSKGDHPAGLNTTLANEILSLSGLTEESAERLFNYWHSRLIEQEERWYLLVLKAFPGMTIPQLDSMTNDEFLRYLSMAEFIESMNMSARLGQAIDPEKAVQMLLCSKEEFLAMQEAQRQPQPAVVQPTARQKMMMRGQR